MSFLNSINIFGRITKNKREEKNMWVGTARGSILNIHYHIPGALWTNFIHSRGITPEMEAPYNIPYSLFIGPLATILVTPYIDRIRNRLRTYAWLTLIGALGTFLPPFLYCLGPEKFRTPAFILMAQMLIGWPLGVVNIARCGLDGAVACRVMHNSVRGRYTSINGMVTGAVSIGIGVVVTWLAKCHDVRTALLLGSVISGLTVFVGSGMTLLWRELPDLAGIQQAPVQKPSFFHDLMKIFKMKEFKIMMPANLLRGLGDGVGVFIFWIALKRLELPPVYAGYVTLAGTIAPFVGNFILGLTMDRFGAVIMIPASCLVIAATLMGTILTDSPPLFLGFLFLYQVAKPIEASAIPLAHYEVVPNEVMGAFSTVRLGLLTITGNISYVLAGLLMIHFTAKTIFIGSAVIKLLAGALYCIGLLALKKHKNTQATAA